MKPHRFDQDPAQIDVPGCRKTAVQAQAARDAIGRGGLGPKVPQRPLDVGLFDMARNQQELF